MGFRDLMRCRVYNVFMSLRAYAGGSNFFLEWGTQV